MTPNELAKKAMDVRGALINDVILLEKIIDSWLAKYFCHNKERQFELFELVFCHDRLNYSSKIQIFIAIIQKQTKLNQKSCVEFVKKHPTYSKDISELGEKRNMLAHWMLDSSDEGLQSNELRFIKGKKITPSITFTDNEISKMGLDIETYKNAIYNLVQPPPPNPLASPEVGINGDIPY